MIADLMQFAMAHPGLYVGGATVVCLVLILIGGLSGGSGR